jgi:hypothetical protein
MGWTDYLNPGQQLIDSLSGRGSSSSNMFNQISDPMDLFGRRAKGTAGDIRNIQMGSARDSITAQQEMLDQLNALYDPYRQASMGQFPNYLSMTTGGQADIPTSPMYEMETERGRRAINRGAAAQGLYGSTARGASLADFLLQAGQGEAARQYGRQLDMQRIGTDAISAMGGAGRSAGQNVSNTYGNLGSMLNASQQNYGQQRQDSMNQGAGALFGLSQYLMQNRG